MRRGVQQQLRCVSHVRSRSVLLAPRSSLSSVLLSSSSSNSSLSSFPSASFATNMWNRLKEKVVGKKAPEPAAEPTPATPPPTDSTASSSASSASSAPASDSPDVDLKSLDFTSDPLHVKMFVHPLDRKEQDKERVAALRQDVDSLHYKKLRRVERRLKGKPVPFKALQIRLVERPKEVQFKRWQRYVLKERRYMIKERKLARLEEQQRRAQAHWELVEAEKNGTVPPTPAEDTNTANDATTTPPTDNNNNNGDPDKPRPMRKLIELLEEKGALNRTEIWDEVHDKGWFRNKAQLSKILQQMKVAGRVETRFTVGKKGSHSAFDYVLIPRQEAPPKPSEEAELNAKAAVKEAARLERIAAQEAAKQARIERQAARRAAKEEYAQQHYANYKPPVDE